MSFKTLTLKHLIKKALPRFKKGKSSFINQPIK